MSLKVARDFSASAPVYEAEALLQRRVLEQLAAEPPRGRVADLGCGTGALALYWPEAEIIGIDIAEGMCRMAGLRMPVVVADMQALPLASESVEGVVSSLALQWVAEPERFFSEAFRVTRPGGWMRLATLLPGTLGELDAAYRQCGLPSPVLEFVRKQRLQEGLSAAGWQITRERQVTVQTRHENLRGLLMHLKTLGARHSQVRGMRTPGDWRRLQAAYDGQMAHWEVGFVEAVK
jgi:malonyl-CoA O-methyltransferase